MKTKRGFSLLEMLIALTISVTLLTASLAALDASFKSYQVTSDSASTHVVTRIIMQRILSMIRTGKEFGPYPTDVLDPALNPVISDFIEFVSWEDTDAGLRQITRIEKRDGTDGPELWYVLIDYHDDTVTGVEEHALVTNLREVWFTLEYDVGPRLRRATVDLTVDPNDLQDANIGYAIEAPALRLISSASPRQFN
jgi:prepilin-type N-terminal cleavage/methylation domain-containing protein